MHVYNVTLCYKISCIGVCIEHLNSAILYVNLLDVNSDINHLSAGKGEATWPFMDKF